MEPNSTTMRPLDRPRSTLTRVSKRSASRSARTSSFGATGLCRAPRPVACRLAADGDDLLDAAHREAFGDDALGEPLLGRGVVEAEQRAGMAGRQHPGRDPALHRGWQPQQPQRVRDLRPGAADPAGELVVGAAEVVSSWS